MKYFVALSLFALSFAVDMTPLKETALDLFDHALTTPARALERVDIPNGDFRRLVDGLYATPCPDGFGSC